MRLTTANAKGQSAAEAMLNSHSYHLGYCTNIHAGENWGTVFAALQQHVPLIKQQVSPGAAFGLGLRASMESISSLSDPSVLTTFKQWLAETDAYVYTVNGFPYGAFHGTQVKADVYRPDWSSQERLDYTRTIAQVLAQLEPPDNFASISTVPGTFRNWATAEKQAAIVHNLLHAVAFCMSIARKTGVTISIALEPEPACLLETVDDVVGFFETSLYCASSVDALSSLCGCSKSEAELALRTHLGICYDICHAAVEFENPLQGIQRMQNAGIPIIKLQLSSALRLPSVNAETLKALECFDEPVYLHQVVEKQGEKLIRYNDLPIAMEAQNLDSNADLAANAGSTANADKEWRVHFHVPVFLSELEHFGTTQHALEQVLGAHARSPIAPHLEVETYTWDVLPERYRDATVDEAIARELHWVKDCLRRPREADAA